MSSIRVVESPRKSGPVRARGRAVGARRGRDKAQAQGSTSELRSSFYAAELRLVIEEDKSTGSYVYKTVDIRTGAVVQQIPREEVLRLRGRRPATGDQMCAVVNAYAASSADPHSGGIEG